MIIEEIRAVVAAKSSALVRRSADDMAVLIHPDFLYAAEASLIGLDALIWANDH